MRVEFVVDFLPCPESSLTVPPVSLSLQNLNSKFQFDLETGDEYLPCAYPPLKAIELVIIITSLLLSRSLLKAECVTNQWAYKTDASETT